MAWQFASTKPIYQQIVDAVALRIFNGTYPMGERLPSVRDLAETAAVNPNTMQRALSELERMGLVSTQRTTGRTVTTEAAVIESARLNRAARLAETFLTRMKELNADPLEAVQTAMEQSAKEGEEEQHECDNA